MPVLLGSLMRIPMGVLTERYGGRRVFTSLLAYTPLPLLARARHDSLGAIIALGFLLGFAGASFAVGVPFVNRWYPPERQGAALGIYGVGMGGTVLAGLTAPRISDAAGISPRRSSSPPDSSRWCSSSGSRSRATRPPPRPVRRPR